MKAKIKEKEKSIKLRRRGLSIREIARQVQCSTASVSLWVKDVPLSSSQLRNLHSKFRGKRNHLLASQANQEKQRKQREAWREEGRKRALERDWRHSAACSLYWAEGTKKRNCLSFPNNDTAMIKFFYDWLVEEFRERPRFSFSYHEDKGNAPKEEAAQFWSNLLNLPLDSVSCFPTKDKRFRSGLKKNRHKYGMGILYLGSTKVCQHIYGALEIYAGVVICE